MFLIKNLQKLSLLKKIHAKFRQLMYDLKFVLTRRKKFQERRRIIIAGGKEIGLRPI